MEEKRKEDGKKNLNLKFEILCSAVDEQQAQNICAIGCAAIDRYGTIFFNLLSHVRNGTIYSVLEACGIHYGGHKKKYIFHGRKL